MLTSCIISDAFLPSSIRETTYFSNLSLYLNLSALIMPASRGCNLEIVHFGKKISLTFLKLFWSVSGWRGGLSRKRISFYVLAGLCDQEVSVYKIFLTLIFGRIRYREVISRGKCQSGP